MTAEGRVAVEDAVEVEDPEKIRAICRLIDLLRITRQAFNEKTDKLKRRQAEAKPERADKRPKAAC